MKQLIFHRLREMILLTSKKVVEIVLSSKEIVETPLLREENSVVNRGKH